MKLQIDLNAPILPGVGAADIRLGANAAEVVAQYEGFSQPEKITNKWVHIEDRAVYRSPSVSVWTDHGLITQICLLTGYFGKMHGQIGIGSTLADAQQVAGPLAENSWDDVEFIGVPGILFEVDYAEGLEAYDLRRPIARICVFNEEFAQSPLTRAKFIAEFLPDPKYMLYWQRLRESNTSDPDELLEKVTDRDSFLAFAQALTLRRQVIEDIEREVGGPRVAAAGTGWESRSISDYLHGAVRWAKGSAASDPQGLPSDPSWRAFAEFLNRGGIDY